MIRRRSGLGTSAGDVDFLRAALLGYEQQRSKIEGSIAELRRQLGRRAASHGAAVLSGAGDAPGRKKRTLSVAARKRIADAQRKRWAASRQTSQPAAVKQTAPVSKRMISAAGKKRIAEAARKRWAAFRAKKAQASALPKVKTAGV